MPEVMFPIEVVSGVPVVTVLEEIDVTNAEALRLALLEAAADGCQTLIVDMTRTQYCDSAALAVVVNAHKRARAEGGEVLLVLSGAAVQRILEVTGIDRVIPSFPSLGEALAQALTPAGDSG